MRLLRRAVRPLDGVYIRGYVHRDPHNDRHLAAQPIDVDGRRRDRRRADRALVEESFTYVRDGCIIEQQINHPTEHTRGNLDPAPPRKPVKPL